MSIAKIYDIFYTEIQSITPNIETVEQGATYTPQTDTPYQELYILPSIDTNKFLGSLGYQSLGIFQITLKYPKKDFGMRDILERVELYKSHFKGQNSFSKDGFTVSLLRDSQVVNMGNDGDRAIFVIRFNYKTLVY